MALMVAVLLLLVMVLRVQLHARVLHARAVPCRHHAQGVRLQLLPSCAAAAVAVAVPCIQRQVGRGREVDL